MDVRAAVARAAGKPLTIETVASTPRGEVLVEIKDRRLHTDAYTLSGADPRHLPRSSSRGAACTEVGRLTSVAPGDHVIRSTPECRNCKFCSPARQPCQAIRATQGRLMPDGTSRFADAQGRAAPYMAPRLRDTPCSETPSRRSQGRALRGGLLGCGVTTGIGAVLSRRRRAATRRGVRLAGRLSWCRRAHRRANRSSVDMNRRRGVGERMGMTTS